MKRTSNSRSSLFLIELIIAILFFSLVSAVCLRAFARSHILTENARDLNAALIAYGHFPRPSGPRSPARQGHIKRPVLRLAEPSFLRPANQCC